MAGRGQHFIPQHFQKPFVIPKSKDQLWMFRRGISKPKLVSRKDAAKKRDFYSSPSIDGIPTLDDLITDYETHIEKIVDEIREIPAGNAIPADKISEIAVHLTFRSAHLRNMLEEAVDTLIENVTKAFKTPEFYLPGEKLFPPYAPPKKLEETLVALIEDEEWYQSQTISSISLARLAYIALREQKKKLLDGAFNSLKGLKNGFFGDSKTLVAGQHKQLLAKEFAPNFHVNSLTKFNWEVVAHNETDAILPDCVCFGVDNEGNTQPLLLLDEQKAEMVILPLSPSTIAVGKRGNTVFDPKNYNDLAVKASFDFFLTNDKKTELLKTLSEIGGYMRSHINSFTTDIVVSHGKDFFTDDSLTKTNCTRNLIEEIQPKESDEQSSVSFTFMNCVDVDQTQLIAQQVSIFVNQFLSPLISSTFLEKIIFVNNFRAALNDIDRGSEITEKGQSKQDINDKGIAQSISGIRDGDYKAQIIIKGFIGNLFVSEEKDDQNFALATISYTLGSVQFLYIQKEKFPKQFLKPIEDPIEGFLQFYTTGVFQNYYITCIVKHRLETIEELETKLIELIEQSSVEVIEKRRYYRENANIDEFFSFAASQAKEILINFAKLFANLDTLNKEREISEELTIVLAKFDLNNWVLQFRQDLGRFYKDLSTWSDYKQIYFVNRHLERWLIVFGVIVDLNNDGSIYLHVPFGSDADYLQNLIETNT